MLKLSLIHFIFQTIPETIGLIALCFAVLKVDLKWGTIVKIGLIQSVLIYLVRSLPISFGVHSIIILMLMTAQLIYFLKCSPLSAFKASFVAFFSLAVAEIIFTEILLKALDTTFEQVLANQWFWTVFGLPQALILYILAFTFQFFNMKKKKEQSC